MEPHTAIARISPGKGELWLPTQNGEASLAALSEEAGLPLAQCEVHKHDLGGGFGRRGGTQDYARQAVAIAKQLPGVPVKLIWSREEDLAHDFYRPVSQCKLSAGIDDKGALVGLQVRVSGQSLNAFSNPASIIGNQDRRQLQGYYAEPGDAQLGYTIPNLRVEYVMRNTHVPVGPWRGVNTNQNGVYFECFLDEAARAAGRDPLEFGWTKKPAAGVFRGIAQFMGYGSYSAAVAEVSMTPKGTVKVHRMVLALNCGHAVNPQQIEAQVQGSVAFGLSATFYGENTVKDGRMVESNFHQYNLMKIAEMPKVETVILPSFDFWGGVGEPTICVVAPAVMNAIHAATGKPVRTLPLKNLGLV
jgi:isoquinoline 1-oxidoreductase subunit beta